MAKIINVNRKGKDMSRVLDVQIKTPEKTNSDELQQYDFIDSMQTTSNLQKSLPKT